MEEKQRNTPKSSSGDSHRRIWHRPHIVGLPRGQQACPSPGLDDETDMTQAAGGVNTDLGLDYPRDVGACVAHKSPMNSPFMRGSSQRLMPTASTQRISAGAQDGKSALNIK